MTEKDLHVGGLSDVFILYPHKYCAVVGKYRVTCLIAPNTNNFLLHFIMLLQTMATHSHEELPRINDILKRLFCKIDNSSPVKILSSLPSIYLFSWVAVTSLVLALFAELQEKPNISFL